MQSIRTGNDDRSLCLDLLPLHLPPEQLKARLAGLIREAVNQGAATVAETVVRHFLALSLHPQLASNRDERVAYCRGAIGADWPRSVNLLAAISPSALQRGRPDVAP
jgi:hypothetical protein